MSRLVQRCEEAINQTPETKRIKEHNAYIQFEDEVGKEENVTNICSGTHLSDLWDLI